MMMNFFYTLFLIKPTFTKIHSGSKPPYEAESTPSFDEWKGKLTGQPQNTGFGKTCRIYCFLSCPPLLYRNNNDCDCSASAL